MNHYEIGFCFAWKDPAQAGASQHEKKPQSSADYKINRVIEKISSPWYVIRSTDPTLMSEREAGTSTVNASPEPLLPEELEALGDWEAPGEFCVDPELCGLGDELCDEPELWGLWDELCDEPELWGLCEDPGDWLCEPLCCFFSFDKSVTLIVISSPFGVKEKSGWLPPCEPFCPC